MTCSICNHDARGQMDACLQSGMKVSVVAEQFSVSKDALARHRRKCLALSLRAKDDSVAAQVRMWLARANDLFIVASASRDVRGQANAIASAQRALEFLCLHKDELNEASRELSHDTNEWTEREAQKFQAYLDWCISLAAQMPHASPELRALAGAANEAKGVTQ
ncbi:MAG TPA: hypothetical protein VMX38_06780 [Verrucomicrobiae bacterium]|nr:hypothetical protein [Verrucomicrobiae bacterium]